MSRIERHIGSVMYNLIYLAVIVGVYVNGLLPAMAVGCICLDMLIAYWYAYEICHTCMISRQIEMINPIVLVLNKAVQTVTLGLILAMLDRGWIGSLILICWIINALLTLVPVLAYIALKDDYKLSKDLLCIVYFATCL